MRILSIFFILVMLPGFSCLNSQELPKPTYDNSLIFSWTHYILDGDAADFDYLRGQFGKGIYAPLCFSSFAGLDMAWSINPADAGSGIRNFKNELDEMISFAKANQVGIHLTLLYGICRNVKMYTAAKQEDLRNCQWYNDNNISSQEQQLSMSSVIPNMLFNHADNADHFSADQPLAADSVINSYVFSTPSRYARKLRAHLEAKVSAAFAYLKQQQEANPGLIIVISAPGESELNYHRLNNVRFMQDSFCDYSPFAVLEFRDWIKHEGLYAAGQKYAGEGYSNGGNRYQGTGGLANFNADFGTSFSSWDLKYFNWSLSDPVDTDFTDTINPDPKILPVSQYFYNNMMPAWGSNYIAGGFDPPRVMQNPGTNKFYDLWHTFREAMMAHYVKDMASIARNSGFPKNRYYTHQIPADYLFGSQPSDSYLNPRYYSSASPMWTANAFPDTGLGVTLYDVNFGTWFARTTLYGIGAANALSDNWAALEYNPDVIPEGSSAALSSVQTMVDRMMLLYSGNSHFISFFKWEDASPNTNIYKYKGTDRGTAAKQFFDAIKDKARQPISTVFTPKKVENFSGSYNPSTGLVNLDWSPTIWTDLSHTWADWGDFREFVIYRGYTENFTADTGSEMARTTLYSTTDTGFKYGTTVYYKLAAVNTLGQTGPTQTISVVVPNSGTKPILAVSRTRLNFCYITGQAAPPTQTFFIDNNGTGALNWTAADDAQWLTCTPPSAATAAVVTVSVNPAGLSQGSYSCTITVSSPTAEDSPQTLTVNLTVKNASQDQMPLGTFDTPADGSTVMSSIPVTGWALDDVGVSKVQLYRDPVTGEGSSLIYIGDANFVEGARPDIETLYPDYPCNYKAGWGYMMLTHFLPNSGNGTFTLYAIATDTSGKEVTLGTKTITCDNAHAVNPFGALDTPAQGGEASGSQYKNSGWVLTPMPNSIPTDGSTINVYVDGVNLGHPRYNIYRSDVASLFPGYANSNAPAGYFTLDTTPYRDGIHSILWTATDTAGNSDGIGSRYFTIRNATAGSGTTAANAGHPTAQKKTYTAFCGNPKHIPVDYSASIRVKTGFSEAAPLHTLSPGSKGITTLQSRVLERVEIHFPGETLTASPLPIGSTLDSGRGIFYWQPGPGFLGEFGFDFVVKAGPGEWKRHPVKIKIIPRPVN